jgi:hypothetical protein
MSDLISDVLYLIFEQLQDDKRTLYSCLSVNKNWCITTIPILWRNPWKSLKRRGGLLLLSIIMSHFSNVSRNKMGEYKFLVDFYQKPLFNYISYCRHLNLNEIQRIINENIFKKDKIPIIRDEIFNLFINENMKFTHLYVHQNFDQQINLINESEHCFSGIEFLSCSTRIDENILIKLTEACKSIKELKLFIEGKNNNYGIVKLIEAQRKLFDVNLIYPFNNDEPFVKILENSLAKHADTIRYFKVNKLPITKILSYFVNLKELELFNSTDDIEPNYLKYLTFPFLQILKLRSTETWTSASLIKNTSGFLIEIKMDYINIDEISNKKIIQAIYQNCPNLKYLKILVRNNNILELERLLISCQYLNGLYIIVSNIQDRMFQWNKLFEILTKSSPTSLFKFKFNSYEPPKLESLKLFFDDWKGRHPMFLQLISEEMIDLNIINRYKEEGIVKKFYYDYWWNQRTDNFEWI